MADQHIDNRTIRAELIGDNTAVAVGITARGRAPVLELCRRLFEAGHDPDLPLDAWRGSTLCLRIGSIGTAARLTVDESVGCRFARSRGNGSRTPDSAPPIRKNQNRVHPMPRWLGRAPLEQGHA